MGISGQARSQHPLALEGAMLRYGSGRIPWSPPTSPLHLEGTHKTRTGAESCRTGLLHQSSCMETRAGVFGLGLTRPQPGT